VGGGTPDGTGTNTEFIGRFQTDGGSLLINGGTDSDTIEIDDNSTVAPPPDGTVNNIFVTGGTFTIDGGGGAADVLTLQDADDPTADTFTITSTTISTGGGDFFNNAPGLIYTDLDTINIQTSNLAGAANGDTVTVTSLNAGTTYNVDANDPPTVPASLPGDTLILNPTGSISVYEQGGVYQFEFSGSIGLNATEFETITLMPGNGVLNVVGDEGQDLGSPPQLGTDEADNFFILGTAPNAGNLQLNGIAVPPLVNFIGVTDLNISTFEWDDDVTLDPYADDTVGGWGIDVSVDGGANDDDVVYGNITVVTGLDDTPDGSRAGVSEDVVLAPSTVAGAGQIRSTNAADGSAIMVADFVGVEDVSFFVNNGAAGDTDSLSVQGTAAADNVIVNLPGDTGAAAEPVGNDTAALVRFVDSVTAPTTTSLEIEAINVGPPGTLAAIGAIDLNLGDGDDNVAVLGRVDGATAVNIDGGTPDASDTITVNGTASEDDDFEVTPGADNNEGTIEVHRDVDDSIAPGAPPTVASTINFDNVETIILDGGGGTDADEVTINGTADDDVITLTGTGAVAGTAWVNDGPAIQFANLGDDALATVATSDITLDASAGDDVINLTYFASWQIDDLEVNGGSPSASDVVNLTGSADDDTISFLATASNEGQVDVTNTGGPTTNYILTDVEGVSIDGAGQAARDTLNLGMATTLQDATITPDATTGATSFAARRTATAAGLLGLNYRNTEHSIVIDAVAPGGGADLTLAGTGTVAGPVTFVGTEGNDTVAVAVENLDAATEDEESVRTGGVLPVDITAVTAISLDLRGGDDTVTVTPNALVAVNNLNIPGGLTITGGDNGTGTDVVNATKIAGTAATLDFDNAGATTLAGLTGATGPTSHLIVLSGVEELTVNGVEDEANADVFNGQD